MKANKSNAQASKKKKKSNSSKAVVKRDMPVAVIVKPRKTAAKIRSLNNHGGIIIRHRELVGDTLAESGATITSRYNVNPGNNALFPWLSKIANAYENYRFTAFSFHYMPYASTAFSGQILVAHDPDPTDSYPTTEAQFSAYEYLLCPPYAEGSLVVPPKHLNMLGPDKKIVKSGFVGLGPGNEVHDSGSLFCRVAKINPAGPATIGSWWVEYEVELFSPSSENLGDGSATLQGNAINFKNTSISTYGYLDWRYSAGAYQGPFLRVGTYIMVVTMQTTGTSPIITDIALSGYQFPDVGVPIIGEISTAVNSANVTVAYIIVNRHEGQFNMTINGTGVFTVVTTNVWIASLTTDAIHYLP